MTVTEARSRTHADLDATRRREVALLGEIHGQVLREAGLADVADRLDRLIDDPAVRNGSSPMSPSTMPRTSRARSPCACT